MWEFIQAHWIDVLCLGLLAWYARDGYHRGALAVGFDVIGFIASLALALLFYALIGDRLAGWFGIPRPFAKAAGFFAVWGLVGFVYPRLSEYAYNKLPVGLRMTKINRLLGPLPALIDGLLLLSLLLSLLVALPFSAAVKRNALQSTIGGAVIRGAQRAERSVDSLFGGAVRETLSFLTINEGKTDAIELKFTVAEPAPLPEAERKILVLVNLERQKAGLAPLIMDETITAVAWRHSADMLRNGYFSHISKDDRTPAARADQDQIDYGTFGENIAFAPDPAIAHAGFMNSPPHKANILSAEYGRAGIGVMDGGVYGLMITQNFAD